MLSIYRRHYGKCKYRSTRHFQCSCPIWMIGRIGDVKMRRSMNLNSWEQAKQLVAKWTSLGFLDSDLLEEPANEAPRRFRNPLPPHRLEQVHRQEVR
jgi:hypothetical protein